MKQKGIGAVKLMREQREQRSKKYATMTIKEEMADLQSTFPHIKWKRRYTKKEMTVPHHREVVGVAS